MPLNPNSFARYRALQSHSQAYLQVQLVGPAGGRSTVIVTLLDTGAGYSAFDAASALQAGYVLTNLPMVTITLANGGTARLRSIPNARLLIENHPATATRILLVSGNATPILSPEDILPATEFGFDRTSVFFD